MTPDQTRQLAALIAKLAAAIDDLAAFLREDIELQTVLDALHITREEYAAAVRRREADNDPYAHLHYLMGA